jgi:hypothetical protein
VFFRDDWIYYGFERSKGSGCQQHLQQVKRFLRNKGRYGWLLARKTGKKKLTDIGLLVFLLDTGLFTKTYWTALF